MTRAMLYFGSFNPVHKGHTAIAEYVLEKGLCDMVALVVSPQNPHKQADELAPEIERFSMAELACEHSAYPQAIRASAVEFLLPRPSYTADTLDFLGSQRPDMSFSILMGSDQRIEKWKRWQEIVERYPIYIYPREGFEPQIAGANMHVLSSAPVLDFASTDIRLALLTGGDTASMLAEPVAAYIREKKLWQPDARSLCSLGSALYRQGRFHDARNCMLRALEYEPQNAEAREYISLIDEIFSFRNTDIYNP